MCLATSADGIAERRLEADLDRVGQRGRFADRRGRKRSAPPRGGPASTGYRFSARLLTAPDPPLDARTSGVHAASATGVPGRQPTESVRVRRNIQSILIFGAALVGAGVVTSVAGGDGSWYGLGALALLAVKLSGSVHYRPARGPIPVGCRVAVIVPFYNEDPDAFERCLGSIVQQSRPPEEIWVLDDGSRDQACLDVAHAALEGVSGVVIHRSPANQGKRQAQGYAFARTTCDILVTIDSDTVLDPDAIAEGLRPFSDPRVNAVTGSVRALNYRTNLLTRLIDLRYANAFLYERTAYSAVGSVVCCCGSLSFFRADVARNYLEDFLSQKFLGVHVQYGDDRRLTQYALLTGRVLVQDTAVAYTLVPERIGHFSRQQLRWNKSFFRESLWALRRFGPRRWPFWISLAELVTWIGFSTSVMAAIYVRPIMTGKLITWSYVAFAVLLAYARNIRYFGRPGADRRSQIATFALAPLYALLHVMWLTPLRVMALLTLRQSQWGTRATVEVASTA
jgi:hyaluronan synthase